MSLRSFQEALSLLYLKPALRRRFVEDPAGAIRAFRLSPREARALIGIPRRPLEDFCAGLEVKNSARLEASFRGTARLAGKRFSAWYREYGDRHSELRSWPDKIEAFFTLLLHELRREGFPPATLELARFERQRALLAYLGGRKTSPLAFTALYPCDVLALSEGRRPRPGSLHVLFRKDSAYGPLKAERLG